MLEIFLKVGQGGRYFKHSGPGPRTLEFDDTEREVGYFGIVTEQEFLSRTDLISQIPFFATRPSDDAPLEWFKFYYKGRFLFIPTKPIISQVTWNELYLNGLVYGTDDVGAFPISEELQINQIRLLKSGPYRFKVRTIQGDVVDPSQLPHTTNEETQIYFPSEWSDLLSRMYGSDRLPVGFSTDIWGTYSAPSMEMLRETSATAPEMSLTKRQNGFRTYTFISKSISSRQWRPVLELITDETELFSPLPLTVVSEIDHYPLLNTRVEVLMDESSGIILELENAQQEILEGGLRPMPVKSVTMDGSLVEPVVRQYSLPPKKLFGATISVLSE